MIKGVNHTNATVSSTHHTTALAATAATIDPEDGSKAATLEALTYGITAVGLLIVCTGIVAFIRRRKHSLTLRATDLDEQRRQRRARRHNVFVRLAWWLLGTEPEEEIPQIILPTNENAVQVFDVNSRIEMNSAMTFGEPVYSSPLVPDPEGVFTIITLNYTPIVSSQNLVPAPGSRSPMHRSFSATPTSPAANLNELTKRRSNSSVCVGLPCNNVPNFVMPGAIYGRGVDDGRLLMAPAQQFQSNNSFAGDRPASVMSEFCDISSAKDDDCCFHSESVHVVLQ
eukprot:GILJ01025244.1.p1 GENE.GILJ01025244.1~~GILJ01025244.1.p1  ORF type:complete len:284 (-),score=40.41 GILJ01025244.1:140-991(-)